jgi:hypothetical protein
MMNCASVSFRENRRSNSMDQENDYQEENHFLLGKKKNTGRAIPG